MSEQPCKRIDSFDVLLTRAHYDSLLRAYLPTNDHILVYWPEELGLSQCGTTDKHPLTN